MDIAQMIDTGSCYLGFEFGSTRIKACLITPDGASVAAGAFSWKNQLVEGIWTYDLESVWKGTSQCYAALKNDVRDTYGVTLKKLAGAGFSAMMHGYLVFDKSNELLVPFRTWRNNITGPATKELTSLFQFAIPQRWSIAHLHQAILNREDHCKDISFMTTLAGYVHWKLSGEQVLGVGDASGMFPIDPVTGSYDSTMAASYDELCADRGLPWKIHDILPKVLPAGENAGTIGKEGVLLLDPSGDLEAGIPLCPPEGDAGTGMVATNSISERSGNVSVGTSVFAMIVLEHNLKAVHDEIDMVTTPDGKPVAMAHSNNGSSDLDAWMGVFAEASNILGAQFSPDELYGKLIPTALAAQTDAGGLLSIGYVSGEHITGFSEGRPLFVRGEGSAFSVSNIIRSLILSSFCALRIGLNILTEEEQVRIESLQGHGGIFRTAEVGQRLLAAATGAAVGVAEAAGEGGAWGMALLAAFAGAKDGHSDLQSFLNTTPVANTVKPLTASDDETAGFAKYFERYKAGLAIERAAIENM